MISRFTDDIGEYSVDHDFKKNGGSSEDTTNKPTETDPNRGSLMVHWMFMWKFSHQTVLDIL